MTPAARLQATIELLESIAATPRAADALTSAYFRARRYMGSKDRAAVSTRLYTVMRHQARLDWWLERIIERSNSCHPGEGRDPENGPTQTEKAELDSGLRRNDRLCRLRALAWMVLGENTAAKTVDELCSGGKFAPAVLSDAERDFLGKIDGGTVEHPDMPDDVRVECPPDVAPILREKFSANFMREMRAMLEPAPLDLRVNILKATRDDILAQLQQAGFRAELCALSPWGVRVFDRPALNALPMLKEGLVDIQDEGSQMIAAVVDARPGERIVDFCAGACGKTLAIAATMQNTGRIVACDVMAGRLKAGAERLRRAGVQNVETRVLSSERDPWVKKHKTSFDRVLVDAPCGGTGTWRRNPDARWRALGPGLEALVKTQGQILDSAARLVRPGGRLIYSTCSLMPDENENQIAAFLATHADFTLEPCGLDGADYLALTPAKHNTDGFFAAVMRRANPLADKDKAD
ncbi:MAG: RsmB/NOP family class I SAM-dependent RNA methyltransferase [Alphaproteobacteria bacterium]|nr:RsmB/NOP family class I SAM-dependent RNA methyltransferase [Alphaproteobacteria bacterium]